MVWTTEHLHRKKKTDIDTDLTSFTKVKLIRIRDLNIKHKTIKFLEDNTGENLDDLGYGNAFLATPPKADF